MPDAKDRGLTAPSKSSTAFLGQRRSILDVKKVQNVGIVLAKLKLSPQQVSRKGALPIPHVGRDIVT